MPAIRSHRRYPVSQGCSNSLNMIVILSGHGHQQGAPSVELRRWRGRAQTLHQHRGRCGKGRCPSLHR